MLEIAYTLECVIDSIHTAVCVRDSVHARKCVAGCLHTAEYVTDGVRGLRSLLCGKCYIPHVDVV